MTDLSADESYARLVSVAGPVSRETFERLKDFETEFRRWNARINLAAQSTLSDLWGRHILDSAQLSPLAPNAEQWLDLGSGGGFPGMVLSILLSERTSAHVDLVESNRKKAAFLRAMSSRFNANATVHVSRIEAAPALVSAPDVVTARALAPLPRLLTLAAPWLEAAAIGLFHKGRDYAVEIEQSRDDWNFDLVTYKSKTHADSHILKIANLKRR